MMRDVVHESLAWFWGFGIPCLIPSAASYMSKYIAGALEEAGTDEILDMCSGGGGPYGTIGGLESLKGPLKKITLSDLYPHVKAYQSIAAKYPGRVTYSEESVNAADCNFGDGSKRYLRTMMLCQHHFPPELLQRMLEDAVKKNDAYMAIEFGNRSFYTLVFGPIIGPFLAIFSTIAYLPTMGFVYMLFRLLFTFIIPIFPMTFNFDGYVSFLRMYSTKEFMDVVAKADPEAKYEWTVIEDYLPGSFMPAIVYKGIPKDAKGKEQLLVQNPV
jgi:hypothetical protein